ncbi:hypothetical protein [Candidatus Hecatella orcuttiae]|uniref:hypothetical protein n=1 Tax=Candidatus Hecatella orcuttiae TaxID=1935119 RepID=UPI002867E8EE|nr:hypothetical protein [Candidatus Hecatella orcuttiae]
MPQYPSREVLDRLARLQPDHYVEVTWSDACEMRDATPEDIERDYHTTILCSGRVYGVRGDYLILVSEETFYGYRFLSIPIGVIQKLRILTRKPRKRPLRILKAGVAYKVVYVYVKPGEKSQVDVKGLRLVRA